MRPIRRLAAGFLALLHRPRADKDLDDELQAFLDASADAKIAAGMTPDAAARAARLELGSPAAVRDWTNDAGWESRVETLASDLRYAVRVLRRSRIFAATAVLTVALGTGANAAMFQLLNAVSFRSLPVHQPERLASIGIDMHGKGRAGMGYRRGIHTDEIFRALRAEQQAFSTLIAWGTDRWNAAASGEAIPVQGLYVSGSYFDGLGLHPAAGRLLAEADDRDGCGSPGAVLSHAFWQTHFGASTHALRQPITLNRRTLDIVGVAPAGFGGVEVGRSFDVAIPLCAERLMRGERRGGQPVWWLDVMGRLAPGVTLEQAQAHLAALSPGLFESTVPRGYTAEWAATYRAYTLTASPAASGVSNLRTQYAGHLWLLFGATTMILVISCANLASLMMARTAARAREIAVRLALGASRTRIAGQLALETLLIAAAGVLLGALVSSWVAAGLVRVLSTEATPIVLDLTPDWRTIAFFAGVIAAIALGTGLAPARRATRSDPAHTLQAGGRSGTATREALVFRRGLVVVQVALSVVLVVAAFLFGRSFRELTSVDLGFQPDVVAMYVNLEHSGVPPDGRRTALAALSERISALPGIHAASEVFIVPMSGPEWNARIVTGGALQEGNAYFNAVGADYFRTLGIPLLAGRAFDERDRPGAPRTAVVSRTFAKRYFGGADPLGQTFQIEAPPGAPAPQFTIVGLAGDTKYDTVREEIRPIAYFAIAQETFAPRSAAFVVRSEMPAARLAPAVSHAVSETIPGASVSYDPLSQYVDELVRTDRLMAIIAALLGIVALVVAMVGLYGVMSYAIERRTAEIGVRMALGADPARIVRMVLRESGVLLALGTAAGILLAITGSRYASGLLYGVSPLDAASFALAVASLGAIGLAASWIPARRASRLAPTIAIRE